MTSYEPGQPCWTDLDVDASAARVTELGGTVSVPPSDIPPGRFSVVTDPHGAVLSLIALTEPPG